MKKVTLIMFVAVCGILSANAQFYLGGSLNFSNQVSKPEGKEKVTKSEFSIAPEIGYSVNQDFDLGLSFGLTNAKDEKKAKTSGWAVSPYARYSFVEFGKFSVWGSGALFFGENKIDNLKFKATNFGLAISPVLKCTLSDRFDLISNLNFLNIGFVQSTEKVDGKKQGTNTNFGLNVNTNDVATLGKVSIGFIYKF
jgi:hypothetical protein